jgi:hypothetical protein
LLIAATFLSRLANPFRCPGNKQSKSESPTPDGDE